MARAKELTHQAVRDWVGDHEIGKGRPYAEGSAISGAVRVGDTLKANVQGTRDRPYRVWAKLADGRVTSADCSCPVGDGGGCKHVAAVLLAYLDDPDRHRGRGCSPRSRPTPCDSRGRGSRGDEVTKPTPCNGRA